MSIKIQKNISLLKYISFKIGGPAKYFCAAENIKEIKEALEFAGKNKLKIFVLGGGSNILISDKGFDGLVIKVESRKLKVESSNSEAKIICDSGVFLAKLVSESVKNNLTGLEWAAGIPGTVGGAICNNAGAFGGSMADIVESVEVLETGSKKLEIKKLGNSEIQKLRNWEIQKLSNKQCRFSYRNSVFKGEKKYIILNAALKLEEGDEKESRKMILEYLKSRTEKQPLQYPSAGSIFRNPVIENGHLKKLIKKYPELKNIGRNNTIPAGWFVEELGLKGKKIGGAMVSEKHGNFIVNTGGAKAEDVAILVSLIKQKARDNFEVQLNEEIEYAGF